jgi:hypothetical protein
MKKPEKKSLVLRTEIVRALATPDLREVIGGRPKQQIPSVMSDCLC